MISGDLQGGSHLGRVSAKKVPAFLMVISQISIKTNIQVIIQVQIKSLSSSQHPNPNHNLTSSGLSKIFSKKSSPPYKV